MTPRASSSKPYSTLQSKRASTVLKHPSKNVSIGARAGAVLCTQKNAELAVCPFEFENKDPCGSRCIKRQGRVRVESKPVPVGMRLDLKPMIHPAWWLVMVNPLLERPREAEPDFKATLGSAVNLRLLSIT